VAKDGTAASQTVLEGQAAIDLWLRGKAAWNTWAQAHQGWTVNLAGADLAAHLSGTAAQRISFAGFQFPGPTVFEGARFGGLEVSFARVVFQNGYTDFTYCKFESKDVNFFEANFGNGSLRFDRSEFGMGYTNFIHAIFGPGADTSFGDVTFNGPVSFDGAQFQSLNGVSFHGASFSRNVHFTNVKAAAPIDFRGTRVAHPLSLDNCKVDLIRHRYRRIFWRARNDHDAACFRRLKQLAIDSKDHLLEQDFFRKEQLAARHWETRGIALIPGFLYEWLSDFGRSILRPTVFLAAIALLSICFYYYMGDHKTRTVQAAALFAMGQLVGISSWSAEARTTGVTTLFGNLATVPFSVHVVAVMQGVLSVISLFLIGLGLRNRFRI